LGFLATGGRDKSVENAGTGPQAKGEEEVDNTEGLLRRSPPAFW
jgi:hypothetical protein